MAKIILTVDGTVLKELSLNKERITIGRRPTNDLVIDHVAISAEHAVIVTARNETFLEDLNSTNGTQINGQPVKKHFLQDNDVIDLAPYKITYKSDGVSDSMVNGKSSAQSNWQRSDLLANMQDLDDNMAAHQVALIRVLTGASAGKEIALSKPLTTIGRPGVQVAVLSHKKQGYFITHVEGDSFPLVNGQSIGADPYLLKFDDVIDLSGTEMLFRRDEAGVQ